MKISDTNALAPAAANPQKPRPATPSSPLDTVSSADAARVAQAVNVAQQVTGGDRAGRLQELEAAIKSGTYQPDAGRIAEQILDAAQVDAKLEALLAQ
jgi:negative regulator of flagellin synthesis FlgM